MTRRKDGLDPFLRDVLEMEPEALDDVARLAETLEPVPPSGELRARIFATIGAEGRFRELADRVAALLDVTVERAGELLDGIDDPANWVPAPAPGVTLYHLSGGPAVQNAITGFIRVEAGGVFPPHEHLGEETVLVIQGRYVDSVDATEVGPGDEIRKDTGTKHALHVKPGPDLVYLAVAHVGLKVGDMELKPGDPRI